jgi:hypothetical protein
LKEARRFRAARTGATRLACSAEGPARCARNLEGDEEPAWVEIVLARLVDDADKGPFVGVRVGQANVDPARDQGRRISAIG